MGTTDANERWAAMLDGWAIPEDLVQAAPESPYFFAPKVFTVSSDEALDRPRDTPSDSLARAALPADGTVLDVGIGAGTASLRLAPRRIVGVDTSREMLDEFEARAERLGIAATAVEGRWPDVADSVEVADVVVCHHVVYNVPDLASFATALHTHASRRVVVELTAVHPMAWMTPYWVALHGHSQPDRPNVDDAGAVLHELGFAVREERWEREIQMIGENDDVTRIARRLCLGPERYDELRDVVATTPPPRTRMVATLWWDRRSKNLGRR